jgi:predicted alpha/beta-fold hydrolase
MTEFSPAWFLRGAHAQTIWGRVARPRRLVPMRREVIETPDSDELVLDHLDTPVTAKRPVHFLLMHGLEGSSNSVYIQGVLAAIGRHGHAATAINFRSCARDPKRLWKMIPNRRPRFYHSGDTGDFDFVSRRMSARPLVAFGASLGGNALLRWLAENPDQQHVSAAATISVPYDLGAGARYLETSAAGRLYVSQFLKTLKLKAQRPDIAPRLDLPRVLASKTFWEFDDTATAPLHGFADAADYYARASSIHILDRITTPALLVSAADDPFVPPGVLDRVRERASPSLELRLTSCGGHVGFISGTLPWRCEYWAEELIVRWLLERASA